MIASIVYIPPPSFKNTLVFVENLLKFPPGGHMIIISEHDWRKTFPKHEYVALKIPPERGAWREKNPQCGISNALFVTAMRIAIASKLTHVLYLESDCRLGQHGWDKIIFKEFFDLPFPVVAAGTLMCWNIFNGGRQWIKRWQQLVCSTRAYETPVHTYGTFPNGNNPTNPTIFPNGAGAVLSVDWMNDLFGGFDNMMAISLGEGMEGKAWDWSIGERVRKRFGAQSFDLFAHLGSVCSCYGDLALTMEERLNLLREKKVAVAHQFKGKETV